MATTEQDTQPEAPAEKETKGAERTYHVLVLLHDELGYKAAVDDGCRVWVERDAATATNDEMAIGVIVPDDLAGSFVAVAERYFNVRTRGFEPQPPKPVWS